MYNSIWTEQLENCLPYLDQFKPALDSSSLNPRPSLPNVKFCAKKSWYARLVICAICVSLISICAYSLRPKYPIYSSVSNIVGNDELRVM